MDELLDIPAASKRLAIGRTTLFKLIRDGRIATCRIGRRTLIPASEVERFIRENTETIR